jgi:hypothetical protein
MNGFRRLATAIALASAAMVVAVQPASAQEPAHDAELEAGIGCKDFPLALDNIDFPPIRKSIDDEAGNPVVILLASGKSGAITYTNLDNGKPVAFPSRGTLLKETPTGEPNEVIQEFSGNVGLVLFPTDTPKGPSTIQLNGRIVAKFNKETGVTEVQKLVGHQIDICARLA